DRPSQRQQGEFPSSAAEVTAMNQLLAIRRRLIVVCWMAVAPLSAAADEEYATLATPGRDPCLQVAFSPDGTLLAGAGEYGKSQKGQVTIWNVSTGEIVSRLHDFPIYCGSIGFSPDGGQLAVASGERAIHVFARRLVRRRLVWEHIARLPRERRPGDRMVAPDRLRFSPDGSLLACSAYGDDPKTGQSVSLGVQLWRTDNYTAPERTVLPGGPWVSSLRFLDDGNQLLIARCCGPYQALHCIDVHSGEVREVLPVAELARDGTQPVLDVSPDGERIAFGGGGFLVLADTKSMQILRQFRFPSPSDDCCGVSFSPEGRLLASSGSDHMFRLWDTVTGDILCERQQNMVHQVQFSPDGSLLATLAFGTPEVRLWDVNRLLEE
ncbi:MAG: hypothetical protein KF861_23065, partial [Planctomycetaceae bacterium]|nr:hypothetical protein [Planctomycetaceae bacterium]